MPQLPKVILNGQVLFITTRTEEGLPFPPNPLMNAIILSALGRAQYHHPVRICHYLFESNHLHMILIVENPDDVDSFMERFKTESAHAVNRLLGRKKRTIWCEGYDSPSVHTAADVIDRIVYIYANPSKDNLEDSIDSYPGLSSWRAFRGSKRSRKCPYIRRFELFALQSTNLTLKQYKVLARKLKNKAAISHSFRVDPNAWMAAFPWLDPKEVNEAIVQHVRDRESEYREIREEKKGSVIGARRLMLQPIDTPYYPKKRGRKMWCICSDVELRKMYIAAVKALVEQAREVYKRWKLGDYSLSYPIGLFAPARPKVAHRIGGVVSFY